MTFHHGRWSRRRHSIAVGAVLVAACALLGSCAKPTSPAGGGTSIAASADFGRISGKVEAPASFKAAQVYLRNVDRNITYMVYTKAGQFRAVAMFPGRYEVRASANGLAADIRPLQIKAGDNPKLSLAMHTVAPETGPVSRSISISGQDKRADVVFDTYENIYPPGEGRDIIERTCMVCHGESWLPAQPAPRDVWEARIDHMMGKELWERPQNRYAEGVLSYRAGWLRFSLDDRKTVVDYMTQHFGENSAGRMVKTVRPPAVDEDALSKAQYIEYTVPDDPAGKGVHSDLYLGAVGQFASRRTLQDLRFDKDGNVWSTDRGAPSRLVKLDPRTGKWSEWITPHPESDLHELTIGRDGMIWLPEHAEGGLRNYLLGFNPKTEKWDYVVDMDPKDVIRNKIKWGDSISIDSKGNIYVNWIMGGGLTKFDAKTKQVVWVKPLPSTAAVPYGQVIDGNDNIFLAMWTRGSLTRFDTKSETWTEFTPPTFPSEVRRLNVDANNNALVGLYSAGSKRPGKLAQLDQTTGRWTEYEIPMQVTQPYDMSTDADGNLWWVDSPQGDRAALLGKMDIKTKRFTFYPKPQGDADSAKIQVTGQNSVWYTPRGSLTAPGLGVLYPDKDKIDSLGAFYKYGPPGYPFKKP